MKNQVNYIHGRSNKSGHERVRLIPTGEVKCIWMTAEQIVFKLCEYEYRCEFCQFNAAFFSKNELPTLGDIMPKPEEDQGTVILDNYQGDTSCESSETPSHSDGSETQSLEALTTRKSHPAKIKNDLYYHPGHIWMEILNGQEVRLGLDTFLTSYISRLKHLILPHQGSLIVSGQFWAWLGTDFGPMPIISPISGLITEVNPKVLETPDLCLNDPYDRGWLVRAKVIDTRRSIEHCFFGQEAITLFIKHNQKLKEKVLNKEKTSSSFKDLGENSRERRRIQVSEFRLPINSKNFFDVFTATIKELNCCQTEESAG